MNIKGKRVAYITLGCKLNFSETSTIKQSLEECGAITASDKDEADIFIINTCSVTDVAEKKGRQMIRRITKNHPTAYVIIVGCYAQLRAKELMQIEGVNLVLGANEKFNVAHYLQYLQEKENHEAHSCDVSDNQSIDVFKLKDFNLAYSLGDRTRCFLKIQDGCDYFCTYCTIPFARGRSRSASIEQVLKTVDLLATKGVKEIILTGVNTGDFGRGADETFLQLLQELDTREDIARFRISSIEPNLLTEEIIRFIANSNRIMPHFHIPLQAGCDEVLELMKRRYDTSLFASRIEMIKSIIPHAFIGVDIIAGMRGETDEYFAKALDFVKALDIAQLHVFPYSERQGTKALDIAYIVDNKVKQERVAALLEVSEQKLHTFYKAHLGQLRSVLFEDSKKGKYLHGYTDNYIKIEVPYLAELSNQIVELVLDDENICLDD